MQLNDDGNNNDNDNNNDNNNNNDDLLTKNCETFYTITLLRQTLGLLPSDNGFWL
jgi:hypothetical protein